MRGQGESESESESESEFWESHRSGLEQTVFPFSAVPLSEGVGGVRSGESESGESLGALVFLPAISEPQGSVDYSLQSPSLRGSGESESEQGESCFVLQRYNFFPR